MEEGCGRRRGRVLERRAPRRDGVDGAPGGAEAPFEQQHEYLKKFTAVKAAYTEYQKAFPKRAARRRAAMTKAKRRPATKRTAL